MQVRSVWGAAAVCMFALTGCWPAPHAVGEPTQSEESVDYSPRIDNDATWRVLAASPGREMVAHTDVVKVIIDLADDWRVYFLQSRRWEIHYFFAERFLGNRIPIEDHGAFNAREYRQPDRRFILGTLTHYRDPNVWAYELIAGDTLDVPRTVRAYQTVRRLVFMGDRLRYRPVPPDHEARVNEFRQAGVPVVSTQEIFGAMQYQPLNPGEAFGYLRFVHGEPDPAHVRRNDIVVIDNVPLDIPVCAGVITSEFQTPLSHVSILASNRGTPDMALRGAMTERSLRSLEGRLVQLHVTPQEWSIRPAQQDEAERAWDARRPRGTYRPALNIDDIGLPDVQTITYSDLRRVGAKAAQLGELAQVRPAVPIPRAFALPFRAYQQHLARNGIDVELIRMLADPSFLQDPIARERSLSTLRDRVGHAAVDPALIASLRTRINQVFPGSARVRLRSSTNAEDLPGFNGAGLYRSIVIHVNGSDAEYADALRAVWASLWAFQAFEERAYFRMDQSLVAMAILVQESIDDDVVNGVAITANPFNEGRPGVFINAQLAGGEGGAVTSARGDDVPEQIMYYTYGAEREFERLSRSSRTHGAPILSNDEVYNLAQNLRAIHDRFAPNLSAQAGAVDVEFILAGHERRLVIVQARPYTVRHDEGRGFAQPP